MDMARYIPSGVRILVFLASTWYYIIGLSAQQEEVMISGERGIRIEVNTTSNFGLRIYREIEIVENNQQVTNGIPSNITTISANSITTTSNSITTVEPQPTVPDQTGSINITIIGLREKDNSSWPITSDGHAVLFEELMQRSYSQASTYQAALNADKSVQATCSQFLVRSVSGRAPRGALNITACSLKSNGTISNSASESSGLVTEYVEVKDGQVWLTLMVSSWEWCVECQQVENRNTSGEFLDVDVEITVAQNRRVTMNQVSTGKPARFKLGVDAYMELSTMVKIDGKTMRMSAISPLHYPDPAPTAILSVTLPRFKTSATFSMIIDPGNQLSSTKDEEDKGQSVGGATILFAPWTHVLSLVAIGLFGLNC